MSAEERHPHQCPRCGRRWTDHHAEIGRCRVCGWPGPDDSRWCWHVGCRIGPTEDCRAFHEHPWSREDYEAQHERLPADSPLNLGRAVELEARYQESDDPGAYPLLMVGFDFFRPRATRRWTAPEPAAGERPTCRDCGGEAEVGAAPWCAGCRRLNLEAREDREEEDLDR